VVIPVKEDFEIYVSIDKAVVMVLFIITVLISTGMLLNAIIIAINRNQKDIKLRHPIFLICQNLGAIVLLSSNYFSIGYPTTYYCYAQIVFLLLGSDLFYLPFLVKALRLYILFTVSFNKQISIRDRLLYSSIAVFIILDTIILISWFLTFPISILRTPFGSTINVNYYYLSCQFNHGFLLGVLIYKTVLCAVVLIVSDMSAQIVFKVKFDKERRKRFRKVNDAVDIKFGITFTLVVLVLVLIVLLIVETNPINMFIGLNFTIWFATLVPLGLIMLYVYKDLLSGKNKNKTTTTGSTGTGTGSSVQKESSVSFS